MANHNRRYCEYLYCEYLSWHHFAGAVLAAYRENIEAGSSGKADAHSDLWVVHSALLTDLFDRVVGHWCRMSGRDWTWFPYSRDAVARLYMRFRKRSLAQLAVYEEEIARAASKTKSRKPRGQQSTG